MFETFLLIAGIAVFLLAAYLKAVINLRSINQFSVMVAKSIPGTVKWRETKWTKKIAEKMGLNPKINTEVRLADRSRCDITTEKFAIEVEWASKWKEAVGQAIHYALLTGKKPGVIILGKSTDKKDIQDFNRCKRVCEFTKNDSDNCVSVWDRIKIEFVDTIGNEDSEFLNLPITFEFE